MSLKSGINNIKKSVFLLFLCSCALSSSLNAKSAFNGQVVYLKECRVCHLGSKIFIETHSFDEWNKILDSDGASLANIHLSKEVRKVMSKENILKNSHSYFMDDSYKETYKNLYIFIIEAAKKNENN